jgi:hypothetical protein
MCDLLVSFMAPLRTLPLTALTCPPLQLPLAPLPPPSSYKTPPSPPPRKAPAQPRPHHPREVHLAACVFGQPLQRHRHVLPHAHLIQVVRGLPKLLDGLRRQQRRELAQKAPINLRGPRRTRRGRGLARRSAACALSQVGPGKEAANPLQGGWKFSLLSRQTAPLGPGLLRRRPRAPSWRPGLKKLCQSLQPLPCGTGMHAAHTRTVRAQAADLAGRLRRAVSATRACA